MHRSWIDKPVLLRVFMNCVDPYFKCRYIALVFMFISLTICIVLTCIFAHWFDKGLMQEHQLFEWTGNCRGVYDSHTGIWERNRWKTDRDSQTYNLVYSQTQRHRDSQADTLTQTEAERRTDRDTEREGDRRRDSQEDGQRVMREGRYLCYE